MTGLLVWKALLLGLINAAPIGPVGLLCLRKNASPDRKSGLLAAVGMASAYVVVAFCVLFGLNAVSGFLEQHRIYFQIGAGIVFVAMGWRGLRKRNDPPSEVCDRKAVGYLADFTASFAMTLCNPVPFATFAVVLTLLKVARGSLDLVADIEFSLLVGLGTISFWIVVNEVLHRVRQRSTFDLCQFVSTGAAVAMVALGMLVSLGAIFQQFTASSAAASAIP